MVAKPPAKLPAWAEEYLRSRRPPTEAELKARRKALQRASKIRERLDIRPLTTGELIRSLRDEE
jgi:hypothetical protein